MTIDGKILQQNSWKSKYEIRNVTLKFNICNKVKLIEQNISDKCKILNFKLTK